MFASSKYLSLYTSCTSPTAQSLFSIILYQITKKRTPHLAKLLLAFPWVKLLPVESHLLDLLLDPVTICSILPLQVLPKLSSKYLLAHIQAINVV
mmetsp:Transcript_11054/g.16919  ORF Transcript_11054/g.16919 Transcript_11054/m.16919 type:complete len:95 (-) Transcript_11054:323-607(-)